MVALVFLTTMVGVRPASAAPPDLDIILLDPTVSNSVTGTIPFDTSSGFVPPSTNPGTDASATDHIIRTNDTILYDINYSVNTAAATDVVVTISLTPGLAIFTAIPTGCGAGSSISTPDTLKCVVGAVAQSSTKDLQAAVKILSSASNNTVITPTVTITDVGDGATPVSKTGYYTNSVTQSALGDTITSVAKYNAMKSTSVVKPVTEGFIYNGGPLADTPGYYVDFPILVREGDGLAGSGVGIAQASSTLTMSDQLAGGGFGAILDACYVNGAGPKRIDKAPYGKIGVVAGATLAAKNTVVDSGTITCTQGAAGGNVSISILNADTSGSSYPTTASASVGVDNQTYVVSGYLRMFYPNANLGGVGNNQVIGDAYTGINPGDPTDETVANLTGTVTLTGQGPAPGNGSMSKAFYTDTNETPFSIVNSGMPAMTSPENVLAVFNVKNTSAAATGNVTLNTVAACDTIDTAHATLIPFDGSTAFPTSAIGNNGVHVSSHNSGSYSDVSLPTNFTVSYGDAGNADCSTGTFYPSIAAEITATGHQVGRVLVTMDGLTPGQNLRIQMEEQVANSLPPGTLINNKAQASSVTSTGVTAFNTGVGQANGQIFTTAIGGPVKYLYKDTKGNALFSASGTAAPEAIGGTQPPGASGGTVDASQQVVGFLDVDGRSGTLETDNVVACDIIPTNAVAFNFDGTTGTANGSPVAFGVVNGTAPLAGKVTNNGTTPAGGYILQYSTAARVVGDDCLNVADGWTTTEPTPSSITKIRATFDLPIQSRERMYVNMLVNSNVARGDVISNGMVQTVNGGSKLTTSASVSVETESVSLVKTTTTPTVVAGANATFKMQGSVKGVGAANSGTLLVTDTLPIGLTYVPGSSVLTDPSPIGTYNPGSAVATPTVSVDGGGHQVLVWNVGTTTAAPGVFIQLPLITFQAVSDISITNNTTLTNNAGITDSLEPGSPSHTSSAGVQISSAGGFIINKTTSTPTILVGGTISWQLLYANAGATGINSTDQIDVLPWIGDGRGTSFHGTITLNTVTATNGETIQYTKAAPNAINRDPACVSNGGSLPQPGTCGSFAATVWCAALTGGTCPLADKSDVTGIRILGGALGVGSGTKTIAVTAVTANNIFTDQYWNSFTARSNPGALVVNSVNVQSVVPIPNNPFVTLVKSCSALTSCPASAQGPGTDIIYTIAATNTGGRPAAYVVITDPMPPFMDYKIGSATANMPGGQTMNVSFSNDNGVTWTYVPTAGAGGAAPAVGGSAGYDRLVTNIRWSMATTPTLQSLATTGVGSAGTVSFIGQIR